MKTLIAALAVASTLVAVANAQSPSRERANSPAVQNEKQVFALDEVFVEVPRNAQPIEAFLLTKDAGPFMVLAKTFRGPDAERYAVALAQELRTEFALPAYILRLSDLMNHKLARNAPPAAPIHHPPSTVRKFRLDRNRRVADTAASWIRAHFLRTWQPTMKSARTSQGRRLA